VLLEVYVAAENFSTAGTAPHSRYAQHGGTGHALAQQTPRSTWEPEFRCCGWPP